TVGNFSEFTQAHFGFDLVPNSTPVQPFGLPPGQGSVVIGSPYFRDNTTPFTYHGVDIPADTNPAERRSRFAKHADGTQAAHFADATAIDPNFDLPLASPADFSNNFVGFQVPGGTNIGAVTVHGALFGNNVFGGAV